MRGALLGLVLLHSATALAHGGLPVSQRIVRQGSDATFYVPVVFWGIWIGDGKGPWTWICEEEINQNRNRHIAISADGAFYATDSRGVTLSIDRGCTWKPAAGELAQLRATDVAVDPFDGATAYVTTGEGATVDDGGLRPADNGLFVTHDRGATFIRSAGLPGLSSRLFSSVRVAPSDAHRIYLTSTVGSDPFTPAVHVSTDSGATFTTKLVGNTVDGVSPYGIELLAVDPRDPDVIYVRTLANVGGASTARQALLRSIDRGATFTEIWKVDSVQTPSGISHGIDGVAVDVMRGLVVVATSQGLLAGADPGKAPSVTLKPTGGLSQAQCVDAHDGVIYACSSAFSPDFAAVARSDDGAQSFQPILEYSSTKGPVDYCPKGTPVADLCPGFWLQYGPQLGIDVDVDGGAGDGGVMPPSGGCGCALGARAPLGGVCLFAVVLSLLLAARRRGRSR